METKNKSKRLDRKDRKIISVDIDGYVCHNYQFPLEEQECIPFPEMITKVNRLYEKGHIIIYHTARHPKYYELTYAWLRQHGCMFHALRMAKLRADVYLDDRNGDIDTL